ncbi:predicted protein [Naegleria gruberi]|uniref:Predicted protein n=1 Tax=Naegleria gruberi TaxID=5762 RepID=D2V0F4_NAEGR|nr:uncharacterized protein NAEGRDRAFT_62276 [Naegleria gruberi]EFC49708.1 predicted protein [Naegleria gruberi]|eukprot:XP_002682452.1 predicted protein [Naegleria gruberi strain NEG-M]
MNTNDAMEVCFGVQSEMNITSDKVKELFLSQKVTEIKEEEKETEDEIGKYVTFNILNTTEPKRYNILLSHPMLSSPVYERTAYVLPDNRQRFAVILGKRAHELKKKKKKKKSKQLNSTSKKETNETNQKVENNTDSDVVFDIEKLTDPNDPNLLKSRIPLSIEPVAAPEVSVNNDFDEDGEYNDFDEDLEIYEDNNAILEESLINMAVNQTLEEQSKRYVDNLVEELEAK